MIIQKQTTKNLKLQSLLLNSQTTDTTTNEWKIQKYIIIGYKFTHKTSKFIYQFGFSLMNIKNGWIKKVNLDLMM